MVIMIAAFFPEYTSVESSKSDEFLGVLERLASKAPSLTKLVISDELLDEHAIQFACSLKGNSQITELAVNGQNLSTIGFKAIAYALKYTNSLTHFFLARGREGVDYVGIFLNVAKTHSSLVSIILLSDRKFTIEEVNDCFLGNPNLIEIFNDPDRQEIEMEKKLNARKNEAKQIAEDAHKLISKNAFWALYDAQIHLLPQFALVKYLWSGIDKTGKSQSLFDKLCKLASGGGYMDIFCASVELPTEVIDIIISHICEIQSSYSTIKLSEVAKDHAVNRGV